MGTNSDDKSNKQSIVYNKLGDAIKYVILHEIKNVKDDSFLSNYFAVIVYMYFHHFLTYATVSFFRHFYLSMIGEDYTYENLCHIFAMNLVDDPIFAEHVAKGKSFEEILEDLNEYEIEPWIIIKGYELFISLSRICLVENKLFFFEGMGKDSILMSVYVCDIEEKYELVDLADEISGRFVDFVDPEIRPKASHIYLKYKHSDKHFCRYDDSKEIEECYSGMPLGIAVEIPVVVSEHDGKQWIEYSYLGQKSGLIEYDKSLKYIVKPTYIMVCSKSISRNFITPFRVYYTGEIKDCSDLEKREVLWQKLCPLLICDIDASSLSIRRSDFMMRELFKKAPNKLLKELLDMVRGDEIISNKENIALVQTLLKLFSEFVDENEDIMDLLYALLDVNNETIVNYATNIFPSDTLFEGILGLYTKCKLESALKDAGRLKIALHTELKLGFDESKDNTTSLKKRVAERPILGTFEMNNGEIEYEETPWEECIMFGGLLVPKNRKYQGIVTKDTNTGLYNLHYSKPLDSDERDIVAIVFNLIGQDVMWIQNK